jgi:hypothetical protein
MPLGLSGQAVVEPAQKSWTLESPAHVHGSDWSMHQRSPV